MDDIVPNVVPEKSTILPKANPVVLKQVIMFVDAVVREALVTINGNVILSIGGVGYPLIIPDSFISSPGGNKPSFRDIITVLLTSGLEY